MRFGDVCPLATSFVEPRVVLDTLNLQTAKRTLLANPLVQPIQPLTRAGELLPVGLVVLPDQPHVSGREMRPHLTMGLPFSQHPLKKIAYFD